MIRTIEAMVDAEGRIRLHEDVRPGAPCRALVTILDEAPVDPDDLSSDSVLVGDWLPPEERDTWGAITQDLTPPL